MADANNAYTLDDSDRLVQLDQFGLLMIEQRSPGTISYGMPRCSGAGDADLPRRIHHQASSARRT